MIDNGLEWGIADEYFESWEKKNKLKDEMLEELIKSDSKYQFLKDYIEDIQKERNFQESHATQYFKEKNKVEYERDSYKLLYKKLKNKCSLYLRLKDKISKSEADNRVQRDLDLYKRLYNISKDIK